VDAFPALELDAALQPITRTVLRVVLTIRYALTHPQYFVTDYQHSGETALNLVLSNFVSVWLRRFALEDCC
jgi:hypothetical protein